MTKIVAEENKSNILLVEEETPGPVKHIVDIVGAATNLKKNFEKTCSDFTRIFIDLLQDDNKFIYSYINKNDRDFLLQTFLLNKHLKAVFDLFSLPNFDSLGYLKGQIVAEDWMTQASQATIKVFENSTYSSSFFENFLLYIAHDDPEDFWKIIDTCDVNALIAKFKDYQFIVSNYKDMIVTPLYKLVMPIKNYLNNLFNVNDTILVLLNKVNFCILWLDSIRVNLEKFIEKNLSRIKPNIQDNSNIARFRRVIIALIKLSIALLVLTKTILKLSFLSPFRLTNFILHILIGIFIGAGHLDMHLNKPKEVLNILREIKKDFYLVNLHNHLNNENKMINVILSNIILILNGGKTDQKEVYSFFIKLALLSKMISSAKKVLELAIIKFAHTLGYFIQCYCFNHCMKQFMQHLVSQCSEYPSKAQLQEGNQISAVKILEVPQVEKKIKDPNFTKNEEKITEINYIEIG